MRFTGLRLLTALAAGLLLSLPACGDEAPPAEPEGGSNEAGTPGEDAPPASTPPTDRTQPRLERQGEGSLGWEAAPLAVGAVAPPFEGRPEGKLVLVFYRGHW